MPKFLTNPPLHLRLLIKLHLYHSRPLNQGQKLLLLYRHASAPLLKIAPLYGFLLHLRLTSTHLCESAVGDTAESLHLGLNRLCNTNAQRIHTLQKLLLFHSVFPSPRFSGFNEAQLRGNVHLHSLFYL